MRGEPTMRFFETKWLLSVSPGHRNYRRLIEESLRQLAHSAFSGKAALPDWVEVRLFTLVPEYAVAAFEASSIAAKAKVTVALPSDTILVPPTLLSMLYLDHLAFGFATFERAGDVIVYADPNQFTAIKLNEDGNVAVVVKDSEDISDRVGVITMRLNPFLFGFSVPELIPHTFMSLLLYRSRLTYTLSHYYKPEIVIATNELISQDEIAARRREIIKQAEDDYGSIIFYRHSGDEKPQITVLNRPEDVLKEFMQRVYDREIEILRQACGCPTNGQLSAVMLSFFDNLESELSRIFPEATVHIGLPQLAGDAA
mgnify:CR=1 FL=1